MYIIYTHRYFFLRGKHIFPYISSSLLVGRKLAYLILSCCFRPTIQYTAKSFLIYGLQMRKWIETNHVFFLQLRSRLRSLTTANHDSRSRLRKGLQLHLSFYFFLANCRYLWSQVSFFSWLIQKFEYERDQRYGIWLDVVFQLPSSNFFWGVGKCQRGTANMFQKVLLRIIGEKCWLINCGGLRFKEDHAFCCVVFPSKPLNKTPVCLFCIALLAVECPQ